MLPNYLIVRCEKNSGDFMGSQPFGKSLVGML